MTSNIDCPIHGYSDTLHVTHRSGDYEVCLICIHEKVKEDLEFIRGKEKLSGLGGEDGDL